MIRAVRRDWRIYNRAIRRGADIAKTGYGADEDLTPLESVTNYNNFYEFGTGRKTRLRIPAISSLGPGPFRSKAR